MDVTDISVDDERATDIFYLHVCYGLNLSVTL